MDNQPKRACNTCAHRPRYIKKISTCRATGNSNGSERAGIFEACGVEGKLWEKRKPRRGLFSWAGDLLFGEDNR